MRRLIHRFANWLARLTEPESFAEYLARLHTGDGGPFDPTRTERNT